MVIQISVEAKIRHPLALPFCASLLLDHLILLSHLSRERRLLLYDSRSLALDCVHIKLASPTRSQLQNHNMLVTAQPQCLSVLASDISLNLTPWWSPQTEIVATNEQQCYTNFSSQFPLIYIFIYTFLAGKLCHKTQRSAHFEG